MDQQKLPNVTLALVLGIISFVCCFCSSGLGGILMSGIALFITSQDEKTYAQDPDRYSNYSELKAAKTIAIIGLVIALLTISYVVYLVIEAGGVNAYLEQQMEIYRKMGLMD